MLWKQPNYQHNPKKKIPVFEIGRQSILNHQPALVTKLASFRQKLNDYFTSKQNDKDFVLALIPIYDAYQRHGAVHIKSTLFPPFAVEHERLLMAFLETNLEHFGQFDIYLKELPS